MAGFISLDQYPEVPAYSPDNYNKIAIVGEAPGEQEELLRKPFVGASGQELSEMLRAAEIVRHDCYITNVIKRRPPNNNLNAWCLKKSEAEYEHHRLFNNRYTYKPLSAGNYLHPELLHYVHELGEELDAIKPNLVIALGNTACWALLNDSGINKLRGTVAQSTIGDYKVLPTYHPAAVMRQWSLRPVCIADLMKAKREARFPEIRTPRLEVWIEPSLEDLQKFLPYLAAAPVISCDIETAHGQITCIGFGVEGYAICVPFVDKRKAGYSYWATPEEEAKAWEWVTVVLDSEKPKLFQNGLYDVQYIWRQGIPIRNWTEDTMIAHHSMFCELPKSLGFLASVYTDYPSWKFMRKVATGKKDDL